MITGSWCLYEFSSFKSELWQFILQQHIWIYGSYFPLYSAQMMNIVKLRKIKLLMADNYRLLYDVVQSAACPWKLTACALEKPDLSCQLIGVITKQITVDISLAIIMQNSRKNSSFKWNYQTFVLIA